MVQGGDFSRPLGCVAKGRGGPHDVGGGEQPRPGDNGRFETGFGGDAGTQLGLDLIRLLSSVTLS